jgi:hypothetical protein
MACHPRQDRLTLENIGRWPRVGCLRDVNDGGIVL